LTSARPFREADAGSGKAAHNLSNMYHVGRGVERSRRRAFKWRRKAADLGIEDACSGLAASMYADDPYAREAGHVKEQVKELTGVAASAGAMEGHDVPPEVFTCVLYWMRKGAMKGHDGGQYTPSEELHQLEAMRRLALSGGTSCHNDGCVARAYTRPLFGST